MKFPILGGTISPNPQGKSKDIIITGIPLTNKCPKGFEYTI